MSINVPFVCCTNFFTVRMETVRYYNPKSSFHPDFMGRFHQTRIPPPGWNVILEFNGRDAFFNLSVINFLVNTIVPVAIIIDIGYSPLGSAS